MLTLTLASGSPTRQTMLRNAGLRFESSPVRIDEEAIRTAMAAEQAKPRDIADTLAEFKARKASQKGAPGLVLGADQILTCDGEVFSKPTDRADAAAQLQRLTGKTHTLLSAAVIYEDSAPVWRHIGSAELTMHRLTDVDIESYLDQAWPDVQFSVGAYHAEGLGAQLFSQIQGDWFSVLGLPLLDLLSYLRLRGMFAS